MSEFRDRIHRGKLRLLLVVFCSLCACSVPATEPSPSPTPPSVEVRSFAALDAFETPDDRLTNTMSAWNPVRRLVIAHGGCTNSGFCAEYQRAETWGLRDLGGRWLRTPLADDGPQGYLRPARWNADAGQFQAWVGGAVQSLDIASGQWSQSTPVWSAPGSNAPAAPGWFWDGARQEWLFVGGTYRVQVAPNTWRIEPDMAVWSLRFEEDGWRGELLGGVPAANDDPPDRRSSFGFAWDEGARRALVFGGRDSPNDLNDAWLLIDREGQWTWERLAPVGQRPSGRSQASVVWDSSRRQWIVYGGTAWVNNRLVYYGDIWSLSEGEDGWIWEEFAPAGQAPPDRTGALGVVFWDPEKSRMVAVTEGLAEVYTLAYDGDEPRWSSEPVSAQCETEPVAPVLTTVEPVDACGPTLGWTAPNGTDGVYFDVFLNGEYVASTGDTSLQVPVRTALRATDNEWSVVAVGCEAEAASAVGRFDVTEALEAPEAPVLHEPDGQTCDATATLRWTGQDGVLFDVYLDGEMAATVTEPWVAIPAGQILPGSQWEVRARGCSGLTASSGVSTLNLPASAPTPVPTLVTPNLEQVSCGSELTWTLDRSCPSCAVEVLVGARPPLAPADLEVDAGSAQLPVEEPYDDGNYLWAVEVTDCAGGTETSTPRTFVVDNTPVAPVLVRPIEDRWVGPRTYFEWEDVESPAPLRFDLLLDGEPFLTDQEGPLAFTPDDALLEHGAHRWSVEAVGCGGARSQSEEASFQVDAVAPEPFELESPADEAWFSDGPITFTWSEVADVDSGLWRRQLFFGEDTVVRVGADRHVVRLQSQYHRYDFDDREQLDDWDLSWPWHQSYESWSINGETVGWVLAPTWDDTYTNNMNTTALWEGHLDIGPTSRIWINWVVCTEVYHDYLAIDGRISGQDWQVIYRASGTAAQLSVTDTTDDWLAAHVGQRAWFRLRFQSNSSVVQRPCNDSYSSGVWVRTFIASTTDPYVPDGLYPWHVEATDLVGNVRRSGTRVVGVDRVRPNVAARVATLVTNVTRPTISWTAAEDALSGIGLYEIVVDDAVVRVVSGDALEATIGPIDDGAYTYVVRALDRAGNYLDSNEETLIVDTVSPSAPVIEAPEADVVLGIFTPNLCFSEATDAEPSSGLSHYELVFAGETVEIDAEDPLCHPVFVEEGEHAWSVSAYDRAGNGSEVSEGRFFVDVTDPEPFAKLHPADQAQVDTVLPTLCWERAHDAHSGIAGYRLEVLDDDHVVVSQTFEGQSDDPFCTTVELPSPGRYLWHVFAWDRGGRQVVADRRAWSFQASEDDTPPACTVQSPSQGAVLDGRNRVSVSFRVSDAGGSGVDNVDICLGLQCSSVSYRGAREVEGMVNLDRLDDGMHEVSCRARDREGNTSADDIVAFVVDATPPERIEFVQPAMGSWVNTARPVVAWSRATDRWSEVATVHLRLDGRDSLDLPPDATQWTPDRALPEGPRLVEIGATDSLGHASEPAPLRFGVDSVAPGDGEIIGPRPGRCVSARTIRLQWRRDEDDGSPVTSRVTLDGEPVGDETEEETVSVDDVGEGPHTWSVEHRDAAGNTSETLNSEFVVDRTSPTCRILEVAHGQEPGTFMLRGTASDEGCGLSDLTIRVDGDTQTPGPEVDAEGWTFVVTLGTGLHRLSCEAEDLARNAPHLDTVELRVGGCFAPGPCAGGVCDTPIPGAPCDDGQFCTEVTTCNDAGECVGTARDCAEVATPCAVPTCDEEADACVGAPRPAGAPCADAACDDAGQLVAQASCDDAGQCVAPVAMSCAPGRCQDGSCASDCAADDDCAQNSWCDDGDCSDENRAPIADAGDDGVAAPGAQVGLNGGASFDPDGDELAYTWTQTDGPAATLRDADAAVATVVAPDEDGAELVFSLVVEDGELASEPDEVVVVVSENATQPPTADISGPTSGAVGAVLVLDGSGSASASGEPLRFSWTVESGAAALDATDKPAAEVTLTESGEVTVSLLVSDGTSTSAPARHEIQVSEAGGSASSGGTGGGCGVGHGRGGAGQWWRRR